MPGVFVGLGAGNVLLAAGTTMLGWLAPAVAESYHVVAAVITLIFTCLVQVLAFTYLTVTFKLMAQAVHVGKMSMELLEHAKSLKQRLTRCLAVVVAGVVVTTASGAHSWSTGTGGGWPHLACGLTFPVLLIAVLVVEFGVIGANSALCAGVMKEYAQRSRKPPHPESSVISE